MNKPRWTFGPALITAADGVMQFAIPGPDRPVIECLLGRVEQTQCASIVIDGDEVTKPVALAYLRHLIEPSRELHIAWWHVGPGGAARFARLNPDIA